MHPLEKFLCPTLSFFFFFSYSKPCVPGGCWSHLQRRREVKARLCWGPGPGLAGEADLESKCEPCKTQESIFPPTWDSSKQGTAPPLLILLFIPQNKFFIGCNSFHAQT